MEYVIKECFSITGPQRVCGDVFISGAKNSALPILFASLLSEETIILDNLPRLDDVMIALEILSELGASYQFLEENVLEISTPKLTSFCARYELVSKMRASILALGPLLSRRLCSEVALPGGCAIGARPVDYHIRAMEALGADVQVDSGYIKASSPARLQGRKFSFDIVSVTGTENLMMAACLAEGETIIENAAREPEIIDLALFLNTLGARITGYGSDVIRIEGVDKLHGGRFKIQADRIEAGSFLVAAAITGGYVRCLNVNPSHLEAVLLKLKEANALIESGDDWISLDMRGRILKSVDIHTAPYPAFPTDLQAQFTILNVVAEGHSMIVENIFENRFMHVSELNRMGADLKTQGNTVFSQGAAKLRGAEVCATDLRASISLVIAALVADGETVIRKIRYIDRGYEKIESKFAALGVDISRLVIE